MQYFFSDLDNTLIYSLRHRLEEETIEAETLNNQLQSCATRESYGFFSSVQNLKLIPVTTRTPEQTLRLQALLDAWHCDIMLVSNGGLLLQDGKIDAQWREETLALSLPSLPALREAEAWFKASYPMQSLRQVEDMMLYTVSDDAAAIAGALTDAFAQAPLDICRTGRKVYVLPKSINKGMAVCRLASRLGIDSWLAAGDSQMDYPMLECAELALIPHDAPFAAMLSNARMCSKDMVFSNFITKQLRDRLAR